MSNRKKKGEPDVEHFQNASRQHLLPHDHLRLVDSYLPFFVHTFDLETFEGMMILDPNSNDLPKRSELPQVAGTPKGAAWFWGENDQVRLESLQYLETSTYWHR